MVEIIGVEANIENIDKFIFNINKFARENKLFIQVFNADMICGKKHLLSAVKHADRALKQNTNTTNSFVMEILLYASGERQLKIAIPKMGVKEGKSNIAVVIFDKENIAGNVDEKIIKKFLSFFNYPRNDKVLEGNIDTLKKFGISKPEIDTVVKDKYENLILEKVAMVDIIK